MEECEAASLTRLVDDVTASRRIRVNIGDELGFGRRLTKLSADRRDEIARLRQELSVIEREPAAAPSANTTLAHLDHLMKERDNARIALDRVKNQLAMVGLQVEEKRNKIKDQEAILELSVADLESAKNLTTALELQLAETIEATMEQDAKLDELKQAQVDGDAEIAKQFGSFECPIGARCGETDDAQCYDSEAFLLECCGQRVCRMCASQWIEGQLTEGHIEIRCLLNCGGVISQSDCFLVLNPEEQRRFLQLEQKALQRIAGVSLCRAADCPGTVFQDDLGQPGTASTAPHHFVCNVNEEHQWCERCDALWHKDQTCEGYQEWRKHQENADAYTEELVRRMGWRRCPGCRNGVERTAGCQAMHCTMCHTAFCYTCDFNAGVNGDAHHPCPGR